MVRILLPVCATLILLTPFTSSAATVYDNLNGPIDVIHGGGTAELGDQVTLAGTERGLTEIAIEYRGDFLDHGLDGDEFISIQFYYNDGVAGAPNTMFYQSALIPILSPTGTVGPQGFLDVIIWPLPHVLAPDTFTWSVQRFGMTPEGTDQVGLTAGGTPSVGASGDFIWFNNPVSGWIQGSGSSGLLTNYHARISATSDPVPVTATSWGSVKSIYR